MQGQYIKVFISMKRSGRSRKKKKGGTIKYLFFLILVYFVTSGVSFLYLRDVFEYDYGPLAGVEESGRDRISEKKETIRRRLYGNLRPENIDNGIVSVRESMLVSAEDFLRDYLKKYRASLLDLYLDRKGIVYLDISSEIKRNFHGGAGDELRFISEIYSGIRERIPDLTAIKILISGKEQDTLLGHIDISRPIGGEIVNII